MDPSDVSDSQHALEAPFSQVAIHNIQTNATKLIRAYPWHTGIPLADNRAEYLNQCLITNDHPKELINLLMVRYDLVLSDIRVNLSNRHLQNKSIHLHCREYTTKSRAVSLGIFYLKGENRWRANRLWTQSHMLSKLLRRQSTSFKHHRSFSAIVFLI